MSGDLRKFVTLLAALGLALPAAAQAAERDTVGSGTGAAGTAAKAPSKELVEGLQKLHAGNQAEIQSTGVRQGKKQEFLNDRLQAADFVEEAAIDGLLR